MGFLILRFRKSLQSQTVHPQILAQLDERKVLTDPPTMTKLLVVFSGVIMLFLLHAFLHLTPGLAALCGVALAIALVRPKVEVVLQSIEWEMLIFLLGLFVVVGGLTRSGALPYLARSLSTLGQGSLLTLALLFFWGGGILSLFISAVPATVAFIPLVQELGTLGMPVNPLWWALALGIGFAGPGTPFATTSNIGTVSLAKHGPQPLTYKEWVDVGLPTAFLCGTIGSLFLWFGIHVGWFR